MDKWDRRYLDLAKFISGWSKDPSTKVGAVLVDNKKRVISHGFNGLPQNIEDSEYYLNNRDLKYKTIIHAETNAIWSANRDIENCIIYTYPFMPCSNCASVLIQYGIIRIVAPINKEERWADNFVITKNLLNESNILLDLYDFDLN